MAAAEEQDTWALFEIARRELEQEKKGDTAKRITHQQHAHFRRLNGLSERASDLAHTCSRACLSQDGCAHDHRNGLFLCLTSGNIHHCATATKHPLTHVDAVSQIVCDMSGYVIGTVLDERTIVKRTDNGDGDRSRTRGVQTIKGGEYLDEGGDDDFVEAYESGDETGDNVHSADDDDETEKQQTSSGGGGGGGGSARAKRQRLPSIKTVAAALKTIKYAGSSAAATAATPQHHQPEPASVLDQLNCLSSVITVGLKRPHEEELDSASGSPQAAATTSASAPRSIDMQKFAETAAQALFSEAVQRKALARCSKSARTKSKTAVRGYARIAHKQGIVPQQEVAERLREQFASKNGTAQTGLPVQKVESEKIRELSAFVDKVWKALNKLQQQSPMVGTGTQRQMRMKQFFYGLVFLLRQGLKLDSIEVFEKIAWLEQMPELSNLMMYVDAGPHKLLTDGRNSIVAALRDIQTRDVTLRSFLELVYPLRYLYE